MPDQQRLIFAGTGGGNGVPYPTTTSPVTMPNAWAPAEPVHDILDDYIRNNDDAAYRAEMKRRVAMRLPAARKRMLALFENCPDESRVPITVDKLELHVSLVDGKPQFEFKATPDWRYGYIIDARNRHGMSEAEAVAEMQDRIQREGPLLEVPGLAEKRDQAVKALLSGTPGPIILSQPKEEEPLEEIMCGLAKTLFTLPGAPHLEVAARLQQQREEDNRRADAGEYPDEDMLDLFKFD